MKTEIVPVAEAADAGGLKSQCQTVPGSSPGGDTNSFGDLIATALDSIGAAADPIGAVLEAISSMILAGYGDDWQSRPERIETLARGRAALAVLQGAIGAAK